jgi:hypothetical protein
LTSSQYWVGKTFYDGEGTTGVGAIGYLDRAGRYTFLQIPDLFDWSVDSSVVEETVIWAGVLRIPKDPTSREDCSARSQDRRRHPSRRA